MDLMTSMTPRAARMRAALLLRAAGWSYNAIAHAPFGNGNGTLYTTRSDARRGVQRAVALVLAEAQRAHHRG
jgi:hypothetical protein